MTRESSAGTTTRDVHTRLRADIVSGALLPGQRLPASDIANQFGASRTPVREALLILENEGLVVSGDRRGFRVRSLSRDSIAQLYEVRALLESFAAQQAACHPERLTGRLADRLTTALDELDELRVASHSGRSELIERLMAANSTVHETIVAMSGNDQLSSLIERTIDRGVIYRAFELFSSDLLERANVFHRMIVERVAAGDPVRAGALMAEHVHQSRDVVMAAIEECGGDLSLLFGRTA